MPEMPFDLAQGFKHVLTGLLIMVFEALGELTKGRDAHGDVEPVEDMLTGWRNHFSKRAHLFAAVGDEGDILIGLNALLFEVVEDTTLRVAVVAVNEADIAGIAVFGERTADDQFKILLPVAPIADIAAIQADDDTAVGNGQVHPVARTGILHERDAFFRQFPLNPAGGPQRMLPDRRGVGAALDRQHIGQQFGRSGIGHERGPPGFQKKALGRDVIGDQFAQGRQSAISARPILTISGSCRPPLSTH